MRVPPWLIIVLGWGVLLLALFVTVRVCVLNAPEEIVPEPPRVPSTSP